MFNINQRNTFQTVGDLRVLLSQLPAETRVCICGDANCFYHEEQDRSAICLDCEDLEECYEEADPLPAAKNTPDFLALFIQQEVPFRLKEMLGLSEEDMTPEIIQNCISALNDEREAFFDFERIDSRLGEVLSTLGVARGI